MSKVEICNKHTEIKVYDNCHCKPAPCGAKHQYCSMLVIIHTHGSFFGAQFVPNEGYWIIHFGSIFGRADTPRLTIPDNEVEYWFHIPGYNSILEYVNSEGPNGPNSSCRNYPLI